MKKLQFASIDLLKYTEQVIDKQPTELEIKNIIQQYVEALHPTHIAIAIPLDQNADFLAHGHVPSPLTVDEFTRVWITAIHAAGINVYFRGTFLGIKGLYDFEFDKNTSVGTADTAITDGKNSWMGRIYQWLNIHLSNLQQGDILGIIPEATNNAFNGNLFLSGNNPQTTYLDFFVELKKLCDTMTTAIKPIYTGFSANVYRDVLSGWIPSLLYDLVGVMSVDYYGYEQTPQEMEKALNELYAMYRQPIFLSEWTTPLVSIPTADVNDSIQEFFAAFARLREKGILVGINYFDGLDFGEGVFTDGILNATGAQLNAFFAQARDNKPIAKSTPPETVTDSEPSVSVVEIETKTEEQPSPNITQVDQTIPGVTPQVPEKTAKTSHAPKRKAPVKQQSKKKDRWSAEHKTEGTTPTTIVGKENPPLKTEPSIQSTRDRRYGLHTYDILLLTNFFIYTIIGADATSVTNVLTHNNSSFTTVCIMIAYIVTVAVVHVSIDRK